MMFPYDTSDLLKRFELSRGVAMNCKCADDEAYIQVVDSIREPILSLLSRSNTSPEIFFERNKLCLLSSVLLKDADISQRGSVTNVGVVA